MEIKEKKHKKVGFFISFFFCCLPWGCSKRSKVQICAERTNIFEIMNRIPQNPRSILRVRSIGVLGEGKRVASGKMGSEETGGNEVGS